MSESIAESLQEASEPVCDECGDEIDAEINKCPACGEAIQAHAEENGCDFPGF